MANYPPARSLRTPPHVSLRNLRRASKLTLEDVCEGVNELLGPKSKMNRGSISAIESGLRGPSKPVLDALAVVYGLDPGDLVTDFQPRNREDLAS